MLLPPIFDFWQNNTFHMKVFILQLAVTYYTVWSDFPQAFD